MTRGFESVASVTIAAPPSEVWDALVDPGKVQQYLHGAVMKTDWGIGSPITWSGTWKGSAYVDKGIVLAFEPERLLRTTHWSPMGGTADQPENYHTVTYALSAKGRATTLKLTQDNNASQEEADTMAANNWMPVLEGLKKTVEG